MAWKAVEPFVVRQAINATSTTQYHPLGTIIRAADSTYGHGEFMYLLGVAATIVGSVVTYHPSTYQTALCPVGNNLSKPVAIAMSVNLATGYGWYQISGLALAAKVATICCVAGAGVAVKTTGLISKTGTGKEIQGAIVAADGSAKTGVITVLLSINRPTMQGRVT